MPPALGAGHNDDDDDDNVKDVHFQVNKNVKKFDKIKTFVNVE